MCTKSSEQTTTKIPFVLTFFRPSTAQENNTAQPKKLSYFASHLIFFFFFFGGRLTVKRLSVVL